MSPNHCSSCSSRFELMAACLPRVDERGTKGTLIFTSATASQRGNVFTSAFAAGKFAERALSQSLAKTYGKENIHVRPLTLSWSHYHADI